MGTNIEPIEICCEDGFDFQTYKYTTGEKVKAGTPIGKEVFKNNEWKLELYDNICFSDEAQNE